MRKMSRVVMNPSLNPLSSLPKPQRFQIMVILSVMWSTIFCAVGGLWLYYGAFVLGHLLLLLGVVATGITFRSARKAGAEPNAGESGRHRERTQ